MRPAVEEPEPEPPVLRVVRGDPTDEEIAALVVVLGAPAAGPPPPAPTTSSGWSAYWRAVRAPLPPGASAWRISGRPGW